MPYGAGSGKGSITEDELADNAVSPKKTFAMWKEWSFLNKDDYTGHFTESAGGTSSSTIANGVLKVTAPAGENDFYAIMTDINITPTAGETFEFEWEMRVNYADGELADTANYFLMGIRDSGPGNDWANWAHAAYSPFDDGDDEITPQTYDGVDINGTQAVFTRNVWYKCKIVVTGIASIAFYLNDVIIHTQTDELPTNAMHWYTALFRSAGESANATLEVKNLKAWRSS